MTDSNDWFQKSIDSLSLSGKAERTQEAYTRALRMLCEFHGNKAPEAITEPDLEAYFLHRKNVDGWSSNTMRICYCGIRFYFVKVLARNWRLFDYLRARTESRLPAILSEDEVRAILQHVHTAHNRAFLESITDLLERGDRDGRREVDHETLCAVIQRQGLVRKSLASTAIYNGLLPTIDQMRSCTFDLHPRHEQGWTRSKKPARPCRAATRGVSRRRD